MQRGSAYVLSLRAKPGPGCVTHFCCIAFITKGKNQVCYPLKMTALIMFKFSQRTLLIVDQA